MNSPASFQHHRPRRNVAAILNPRPKMKRILIVEDNPANRELLREVLESRGYEVEEARNGKEALHVLPLMKVDLAIVDLQMPEMDGITLVRLIREHPAIGKLPVLALTAYAMHGDKERALQSGFDGYLTKPFQIGVLTQELKQLLGE